MAKRSQKKAHKRHVVTYEPAPSSQHEQAFIVKLVQLVSGHKTLYGLDEKGRVFAYLDAPVPGWVQIDGDDLKLVLKPVDLDALGKEHASKLPDDQRHAVTMERDRERRERQWEALERILPMLDSVNNNIAALYNRVFAMEEKAKKNGVEAPAAVP